MKIGLIILAILSVGLVIFISYKIYSSYENKVDKVKNKYLSGVSKYKNLLCLNFDVRTDGKKIKAWDSQHIIDYIINNNINSIIDSLNLLDEFRIWVNNGNREKVFQSTLIFANMIANDMIIFGHAFRKRTENEIGKLNVQYDPKGIYFVFKTYTYHSNTRHYNPYTHEWWNDASPIESTFQKKLSPDEVLSRINILAKYDYKMTEYQYNCDNQRKLMTKELRDKVIKRDGGICQICGKKCRINEIEIDHIQPVSKGGKTMIDNLQVLCVSCNRKKSNKWNENVAIIENKSVGHNYNYVRKDLYKTNAKPKEIYSNENKIAKRCVKIGDKVTIVYVEDNEELIVKVVEKDADSSASEISIYSPIGKAILGKSQSDDIIDVITPNGTEKIKITYIE